MKDLPEEKQLPLLLLETLTTELSHDMRSPLGVALSVVKDAAAGLSLSAQDFRDAEDSLKTILSYCDTVQEVSHAKNTSFSREAIIAAWYDIRTKASLPSLKKEAGGYNLCWKSNVSKRELKEASETTDRNLSSALSNSFSYLLDRCSVDSETTFSAIEADFTISGDTEEQLHCSFAFVGTSPGFSTETIAPASPSGCPRPALSSCLEGSRSAVLPFLPFLAMALRNQAGVAIQVESDTSFSLGIRL